MSMIDLQEACNRGFHIADRPMVVDGLTVRVPNSDKSVYLRTRTSDPATFRQVFIDYDYSSEYISESICTIIDLGCNIGLASVYFALHFPTARIFAVEPDVSNLDVALHNTSCFGERVKTMRGAAWSQDGSIALHVAKDGIPIPSWGMYVSECLPDQRNYSDVTMVDAFSMPTIIKLAEFEYVDVLKIDIEGAELEIFSSCDTKWLSQVGLIIIETHDRFREGSEAAVRKALSSMFVELPKIRENLYFANKNQRNYIFKSF